MTRSTALWILAAALIAAALAFAQWQHADEDAERTGDDPDRTTALVLLGIAGVATISGTIVYVNTNDDDDTQH